MAELVEVNNPNEYYKKLKMRLDLSSMWYSLQGKSEYGSDRSEMGYQMTARSLAGGLARRLHLNDDLAELLSMCRGSVFPAYGNQGMDVMAEAMNENGIHMSREEFARKYVEYNINSGGGKVSKDLDILLRDLFAGKEEGTAPEVVLANICYDTVEDAKRIENYSSIDDVDLLYRVTRDVEEESMKNGKPTRSKKLGKMMESVPKDAEREMGENERAKIREYIQSFVDYYGKDEKAFYEYMTVDGPEL